MDRAHARQRVSFISDRRTRGRQSPEGAGAHALVAGALMRRRYWFRAGRYGWLDRCGTTLEPVAHRVDQRSRGARAIEQRLRVRQDQRTVPRTSDEERQLEG